jgi:hypothetical protein
MPAAWQATTATTQTLTGKPGTEYCVSVRARDHAGNVSGWSADRCQVVPLDDRTLSRTKGWVLATPASAYLRTLTTSTKKGGTLKLAGAHAKQIALLVTTCAKCGNVEILLNGKRFKTVHTHSSSTRNQVLVIEPAFSARTTSIQLTTTSHKVVKIDGLSIANT